MSLRLWIFWPRSLRKKGPQVQQAMKHLLKFLADRLSSASCPRVLFFWNTPTRVSGRSGVVPDLIRMAGRRNSGDELELPYATVSLHDPNLALTYADRVLCLKEGKLVGKLTDQDQEGVRQTLEDLYHNFFLCI